ncbi:hypothetical protein [Bacillus cereus group sp. BfR-BA-01380]|nr:hypothetical protein [Bacillus cereus group sp. BfR-BA-01380]
MKLVIDAGDGGHIVRLVLHEGIEKSDYFEKITAFYQYVENGKEFIVCI